MDKIIINVSGYEEAIKVISFLRSIGVVPFTNYSKGSKRLMHVFENCVRSLVIDGNTMGWSYLSNPKGISASDYLKGNF